MLPSHMKYLNFAIKIQELQCIMLTCFKNENEIKNEKYRKSYIFSDY